MELELVRLWPTPADCTGTLSVDGIQKYATLELPIGNNVPYVNCIPAGVYPVQLLWSARFNRTMPHLGNTAPRGPILIHYGNTAHDTEGCILVGMKRMDDSTILESVAAFNDLFPQLQEAVNADEEITITISNPQPAMSVDNATQV